MRFVHRKFEIGDRYWSLFGKENDKLYRLTSYQFRRTV